MTGTSSSLAAKWNTKYANSELTHPVPAAVLVQEPNWLPKSGKALDLACGLGANARWLVARGLTVSAWDISTTAIELLRSSAQANNLTAEVRDVITHPPEADSFDVIVVSRFLDRSLCPALTRALTPGGVLFYQTFITGLANKDYMLAPDELPTLFPELTVRMYQETSLNDQYKSEALFVGQRVVAD